MNRTIASLYNVYPKSKVKPSVWKNGKGVTYELLKDKEEYNWRVSAAEVSTNEPFSKFVGYKRNLFLLEGKGVELVHAESGVNTLTEMGSYASFNGGEVTTSKLLDGPILDLNFITKEETTAVTYRKHLGPEEFFYCPTDKTTHSFFFSTSPTKLALFKREAAQEAIDLEKHTLIHLHHEEHETVVCVNSGSGIGLRFESEQD
eukprot:TRINITY_DN16516_c1_g1_i1.p1 TRINITY_DN16516_c1_g1~~TRINITY_DN16516_c1_g1_i1.p1  ORF type:complete len:203 (+),score=24.50 TRINITY_DN16516_c1_g1_i1:40-648(+)